MFAQLIHGDLHYDNTLVDGDRVTGLLDFEFCAVDYRAMELAICLSKYSNEDDPLPLFEAFCSGFLETGQLTMDEAEAIPGDKLLSSKSEPSLCSETQNIGIQEFSFFLDFIFDSKYPLVFPVPKRQVV